MGIELDPVDFDELHADRVPALAAAGYGALAARGLTRVAPLAFRLPDGRAYTYVPVPPSAADGGGATVSIRPGDADAATVVELDEDVFSEFALELRTAFGLLYAGLVRFARGGFDDLVRWEPPLRALYHGRPLYDPALVAGRDDLGRSFGLDDADADLREFLDATGYLHVRGVFDAAEVEGLRAEVERLASKATPDDGRSWWTHVDGGAPACCRLIYAGLESGRIAALGDEPRLRRLAALTGTHLEPAVDRLDGHTVVVKQPGARDGLADLPWHQDCGLGGHPVLCPGLNVGIQLDAASPESGQLHFLAGSWRTSARQLLPADEAALPVVAIRTEPGDVTVHYGHALHAAPPPTGRGPGRRALYVTYVRPEALELVGRGRGYNDVLFARDGRVHHVDEIRSTVQSNRRVVS